MSKVTLMMLLAFLLTYGNHASGSSLSQIHQLHTGWEFSMYGTNEWLSAQVPGTVHQDLIAHDKLPDPFYGMNEQKIQWVEKEDWLYRTSFVLTEEQLHHEGVYLVFEGLDTYADVFLNGSLLLKADNMFMGYRVPVKSVLRKGENSHLPQTVFPLVHRNLSLVHLSFRFHSNSFEYFQHDLKLPLFRLQYHPHISGFPFPVHALLAFFRILHSHHHHSLDLLLNH